MKGPCVRTFLSFLGLGPAEEAGVVLPWWIAAIGPLLVGVLSATLGLGWFGNVAVIVATSLMVDLTYYLARRYNHSESS